MSDHSDRARPWWASDPAEEAGPDAAGDPLEQHRAARRGDEAPDPAAWLDAAVAGVVDLAERAVETARGHRDATRAADDAGEAEPGEDHDVCGVCPICVGLRTLRVSRPELADHLTLAAGHLAAAVRELLEDPPARARGRDEDPPDELERIDLQ